MKIVDRQTFLSLPENTLFSTYDPQVFGPLEIKGASLTNDFYVQDIASAVASTGDQDECNILDHALQTGSSFRMDFNCEGRDGCFEDNELYAVWEREDVESLISRLQECIK